jgi:hypothetical protein
MENNIWRISYNGVRFIKSQRLRWLGNFERMDDNEIPKSMTKGKLYCKRRKGSPRMRRREGGKEGREGERKESFQPLYGPGIDSASIRNKYQETSWG